VHIPPLNCLKFCPGGPHGIRSTSVLAASGILVTEFGLQLMVVLSARWEGGGDSLHGKTQESCGVDAGNMQMLVCWLWLFELQVKREGILNHRHASPTPTCRTLFMLVRI